MKEACVTARIRPGVPLSCRARRATRSISARIDSPPCGAQAGSLSDSAWRPVLAPARHRRRAPPIDRNRNRATSARSSRRVAGLRRLAGFHGLVAPTNQRKLAGELDFYASDAHKSTCPNFMTRPPAVVSSRFVTNSAARVAGAVCFWQDVARNVGEKPPRALIAASKRADRAQGDGTAMIIGLILLSGVLSLVYGGVTVSQLMAADAGSQKMQEISGAVAEGAQAYLKRQYTTIAGVGVVVFIGLGLLLSWDVAIGFLIGAVLSGAAGFIGMNVSVRANVRTAQAATKSLGGRPRHRLQGGRDHRHAGGRSRAARRRRLFLGADRADGLCPVRSHRHRLAGGARLRRLADFDLRPSRRRHLHQGRRRRRRSRRQGRGRHSRGRSAQSGHDRRQCRRQRRRLRRHGGRPVRDLCGDGRGDDGARLDLLRGHRFAAALDDLSAGDLRRLHRHLDRRHAISSSSAPTIRSWARSTRA